MNQEQRPPQPAALEILVAAHLAVFIAGTSWAFGGNADWVRTPISIWGSLGMVLTLVAAAGRLRDGRHSGAVLWAWPVVAFNAVVAASCLTPGFRHVAFEGADLMMPVRISWWVPSTAGAGASLRSLWLFDGIYFSCLNLALVATRRRTIRLVLGAAVANALALAVFGTVQKLIGSTGIYFGLVRTPHMQFFASFVYDNHWGAFAVLMLGACAGLILRYVHGTRGGGFFNGPAFAGVVAAVLLGISVPLSGSRACTLLMGVLAAIVLVQGIPRLSRALAYSGVAPGAALAGMALAALLAVAAAWLVAGDVIEARTTKTKEQVRHIVAQGGLGSRAALYHDTWRMARERILFGWGMGSFPVVFPLYNTQESRIDRLPVIYHDAHADWLQSAAEVGLAGTALLGAAVLLPACAARRSRLTPIPYFLLCGCVLAAAYAWVEFPFGNVAVVLAWWLCYFSAIRYMLLTRPPAAPEAAA